MKQFGIVGDLTPFEPVNPALDIPDGDPLELKKVTDQSMNAFYGELASAIINSGQTLTPTNGTSPNTSQLWNAISSARFGAVKTGSATGITTNGQVFTNTLNFVAPCDGFAILMANLNVGGQTAGRYENVIFVNGVTSSGTSGDITCSTIFKQACLKGQSYIFKQEVRVVAAGTSYINSELSYLFLAGA